MKNRVIVENWKKFLSEEIEKNQFGVDQFSQDEIVDEHEKQQAIDLICSSLKEKMEFANVQKINEDYTMYKFEIRDLGISILISADKMIFIDRIR